MLDVETLVDDCTEPDRHAVFIACQLVALADGRVWREASALDGVGDALKLKKQQRVRIARQVRKQPKRKCPMPRSEAGKRLMFHFAAQVASADGRLDERERKVVGRLGKYLGIESADIDAELAGTQAKADRITRRRRDSFLEASGVGGREDSGEVGHVDGVTNETTATAITSPPQAGGVRHEDAAPEDAETLEELLVQVRTPSEEDVYHRLLLHPLSESSVHQQFGLKHVGYSASVGLMWSLVSGAMLAVVRASSNHESVLETILMIFVVIGFVMMIPPLLSYWLQSRSQGRSSRRFGDAEVHISGTALAPGSELHADLTQPNRSAKTLHNVSLQMKLVRHVADQRLVNPKGECRPFGDILDWNRVWSTSQTIDASTVEPGESIRGVCQFSIPDQMPLETKYNQWWGINVVTSVANKVDYSETMWIPPRHSVGCGLLAAGAVVGGLLGFLTVALVGAVVVLSSPTISDLAIGVYGLCLFGGTFVGFVLGTRLPNRLSNKVRFHPAMAFALPGAIGIVVCVLMLLSAVAPMFVSLPESSPGQQPQSKTDAENSAKAKQQQQREQLLKQYQRTVLFRPADEVRAILTSHPELIERRLTDNRWNNPTALHHCAQYGKLDVAKVLLDLGANPDARTRRGRTPLHVACGWKQTSVVELLLEYSADVFAKDVQGLVPRRFAELNKDHPEKRAEILRMIDEHTAELEAASNKDGAMP